MNHFLSSWLRAFCVSALALTVMTNAAGQDHSTGETRLVGTWYGEFSPNASSPVQRFITTRRVDGTFDLQARMYQDNKMVGEARNNGMWGLSNGMYFTVTTEVNGKPSDPKRPEAVNAYLVKSLEADRFSYVHVASGGQFTVTRVDPASARLPD